MPHKTKRDKGLTMVHAGKSSMWDFQDILTTTD